jgi:hypothetical protein
MKCPFCNSPVNIFAAEWRSQPTQDGTRKCPHCSGGVKNVFSGPVSIAIVLLTLGLAVIGHSVLPAVPLFAYGILGGAGVIVFGLRLVKA